MTLYHLELEGTYASTGTPNRVDCYRLTGTNPNIWTGFGSSNNVQGGTWTLSCPEMTAVPPNMTIRTNLMQGAVLLAFTETNVSFP